MKKSLFLSISVLGLIGTSMAVYGQGWRMTGLEPERQPRGDCLEMVCEHGCVENDQGVGSCCSTGQTGEKCYGGLCCQEGLVCSSDLGEGACVCPRVSGDQRGTISENNPKVCCFDNYAWNSDNMAYSTVNPVACGCPKGSIEYIDQENKKQCCSTSSNVLLNISGGKKACCPSETPYWDSTNNKCVECLENENCQGELTCSDSKCVSVFKSTCDAGAYGVIASGTLVANSVWECTLAGGTYEIEWSHTRASHGYCGWKGYEGTGFFITKPDGGMEAVPTVSDRHYTTVRRGTFSLPQGTFVRARAKKGKGKCTVTYKITKKQ